MKIIMNLLVIVGFCAATLGATGFDKDGIEPEAPWIFGIGLAVMVAASLLGKTRVAAGDTEGGGARTFATQIESIRAKVADIDDQKRQTDPSLLRERVEQLLESEYFELTRRNEELAGLVSADQFARIWDGIANGERFLNRFWTLSTDGHNDEGIEELPRARAQLERALEAASALEGS